MRTFQSLSEQEILALAISLEEEDARIYGAFAGGLKADSPATAAILNEMRAEEDGHRHRLLELHRQKFGEHIPLIRGHDVKGFVSRKPIWLVRPLGLSAVRKETELMELETRRFYETAIRQTSAAGIRQLLGDRAEQDGKQARRRPPRDARPRVRADARPGRAGTHLAFPHPPIPNAHRRCGRGGSRRIGRDFVDPPPVHGHTADLRRVPGRNRWPPGLS